MPLSRRTLLESAGTGLVGGYALSRLPSTVWPGPMTFPIEARNPTAEPYTVTVSAFRGGPGGETLVFERDATIPATDGDDATRRTLGEIRGTHRVVVEYRASSTVELFTDHDTGDCTIVVWPPGSGHERLGDARVSCAV